MRPAWERVRGGKNGVSAVSVGPFRLIARCDSYTLTPPSPGQPLRDIPRACQESTLQAALAYVAVWETERVVKQARVFYETGVPQGANGAGWDTFFERIFEEVLARWCNPPADRLPAEAGNQGLSALVVMRWGDEVSICVGDKLMFEIAPEVDPDEADKLARSFLPKEAP